MDISMSIILSYRVQSVPELLLAELLYLLALWHLVFILKMPNCSIFRDNLLLPTAWHAKGVYTTNENRKASLNHPPIFDSFLSEHPKNKKLSHPWRHSPYRRRKCTKEKRISVRALEYTESCPCQQEKKGKVTTLTQRTCRTTAPCLLSSFVKMSLGNSWRAAKSGEGEKKAQMFIQLLTPTPCAVQ